MKTAYFILGMHRSGTSALAGVLNLMGLEFGSDLMKADVGNPKGYFENNFVYELNKKILEESKSTWDDYNFNSNKISNKKQKEYAKEAKALIELEFKDSSQFVIKDPRICLLFPLWEEACLELNINIKIIIPYRNPLEVVKSLESRDKFSYEKSLLLWSQHFLFAEKSSREYDRIFISFDDLLTDTKRILKELEYFVSLSISKSSKDKINLFLDGDIKNHNSFLENSSQKIPLYLEEIIQILKDKNFEENQKFDLIRNEFVTNLTFFQPKEVFNKIQSLEMKDSIIIDKGNEIRERDQLIKVQKESLEKRDTIIIEKSNEIRQKNEIVKNQKENLLRRDELIIEKAISFRQINQVLKNQRESLEKRDIIIIVKSDEIRQKDKMVRNQKESLEKRDIIIIAKSDEIRQKNKMVKIQKENLEKRDIIIITKSDEIRQKNKMLKVQKKSSEERDSIITKKSDEIRHKDKILKVQKESAGKRDTIIVEKSNEIRQKDKMVKSQKEGLEKRDTIIIEKSDELRQRDKMVKSQKEGLKKRDTIIIEKSDEIRQQNRKIKELQGELFRYNTLTFCLKQKIKNIFIRN